MSVALLDSGAFIAIEKRDRGIGSLLRQLERERIPLRTSAAVVAQVWRDGARQARLARVLAGVRILPLDYKGARGSGELQGMTGTADVVDAHLALLAAPGDQIVTSDPDHIGRLLRARGVGARVIEI